MQQIFTIFARNFLRSHTHRDNSPKSTQEHRDSCYKSSKNKLKKKPEAPASKEAEFLVKRSTAKAKKNETRCEM
jgi:hypothetical protein